MFMARVIGHVWSTVKWDSLAGLRFLLVRPYSLNELAPGAAADTPVLMRSQAVVVADVLGAGPGEDVIVAYGHAARVGIEELQPGGLTTHPVDAAVVAIVDQFAVGEGDGLSHPRSVRTAEPRPRP